MTKGTRYFIFGSLTTLVVGLSVGLFAFYSGFTGVAFSTAGGPEELRFLPGDATLVAYANVRDVMNSEFRQHIRDIERGQDREEFEQRTGINIERDIERVVACLAPDAGGSETQNGLVLARGHFDPLRVESLARERGASVGEYKGKRLITHEGTASDRPMALVFVAPDLVAIGTESLVRSAIDLDDGGRNVTDNDELMRLVRDMDDGNAWAVGRFDTLAMQAKLPAEVSSQLPAVTWFAASGHIDGGITGTLRAEARDEKSADNLREVVRGFMALARLQAGSKPAMQSMVQSLQLSGTGTTVALSFSVPVEILDGFAPEQQQVQPAR